MLNETISAGLICFSLLNCVYLPNDVNVIITNDSEYIEENCLRPVLGCARYAHIHANKDEIVLRNTFLPTDDLKTRIRKINHLKAVYFHELLHIDLFYRNGDYTHSKEFNEREQKYIKYLSQRQQKWEKETFLNLAKENELC